MSADRARDAADRLVSCCWACMMSGFVKHQGARFVFTCAQAVGRVRCVRDDMECRVSQSEGWLRQWCSAICAMRLLYFQGCCLWGTALVTQVTLDHHYDVLLPCCAVLCRHLRRCLETMQTGLPPWMRPTSCWAWTLHPSLVWSSTCRCDQAAAHKGHLCGL
jgi:hypothetical protein